MSKIIAIGDTHGRDDWRKIIDQNPDADKYIFIGDYFDTHEDTSPQIQIENFKMIMEMKHAEPDKFIILIGNHDFHYLRSAGETYSGYQNEYAPEFQKLLHQELQAETMQICYRHEKYLLTHAGITASWAKANGYDGHNIEGWVNKLFRELPRAFKFTPGAQRNPYGDEVCQSPIWVRPDSLVKDAIPGYIQIVGHTTMDNLSMRERSIFIDCLGTSGQYLEINNGVLFVKDQ